MPGNRQLVIQIPGDNLYPITRGVSHAFAEIINITAVKINNIIEVIRPEPADIGKYPGISVFSRFLAVGGIINGSGGGVFGRSAGNIALRFPCIPGRWRAALRFRRLCVFGMFRFSGSGRIGDRVNVDPGACAGKSQTDNAVPGRVNPALAFDLIVLCAGKLDCVRAFGQDQGVVFRCAMPDRSLLGAVNTDRNIILVKKQVGGAVNLKLNGVFRLGYGDADHFVSLIINRELIAVCVFGKILPV